MSFVILKLRGGLGNQLFQYSAARFLAQTRDSDLIVDESWYSNVPKGNTQRNFDLRHLELDFSHWRSTYTLACWIYGNRFLGRIPMKFPGLTKVREPADLFSKSIQDIRGSVFLDGYWQNYNIPEILGNDLRIDLLKIPHGKLANAPLARAITSSESVAVHVRRGDYVTNPAAAAFHGVCEPEYYLRAVELIHQAHKDVKWFVFSDDISWAEENLTFPSEVVYVDERSTLGPIADLYFMSLCTHHIIANSSFSWWGAWLGYNKDQIVVVPDPWFVGSPEPESLIPSKWIKFAL